MKNNSLLFLAITTVFLSSACITKQTDEAVNSAEVAFAHREGQVQDGGVRLIPVQTPLGNFRVWTKSMGNNPELRVLLLAGGPGISHEYLECFESFLPDAGIEMIYYDQLGCGYSDHPSDTSLWDLPRFVEEVEQVRLSLGLDSSNFVLFGHSWGGILAMQYALKYQRNLKGLVVSNMMCSCPQYGRYADEVLALQMPAAVLDSIRLLEAAGDFSNPRYMALLGQHYYQQHICRIPQPDWPEPVNRAFAGLNSSLYVSMQGPSEFGISGKLESWDVCDRLKEIIVPTLIVGAQHDTMDPEHMKAMSTAVRKGQFLFCPSGSHMCFYDDQSVYFDGLIRFLQGLTSSPAQG